MTGIILASSSRYRAQLMRRFQQPFSSQSPDIDESSLNGEAPHDLALRLSREKAQAIAANNPNTTIIGSDQVCALGDLVLGKPKTDVRARQQLQACSDQRVEFFTGLCVITPTGGVLEHVDQTTVAFRTLGADEIARYVDIEQPLDCAGSFKLESLGPSLFNSVTTQDPNALIGLPMIKLAEFLRQAGHQIP